MKKIIFLFKIFITSLFFFSLAVAENIDLFKKGKNLFENKKFDESKIFFERDIVFNPLSEYSYLYLAKIFNEANNYEEEEVNLKNALLINPNNSEAVYMLANVNIRKSDYDKAKELIRLKTRQYAKRQFTWARGHMKSWEMIYSSNTNDLFKKAINKIS